MANILFVLSCPVMSCLVLDCPETIFSRISCPAIAFRYFCPVLEPFWSWANLGQTLSGQTGTRTGWVGRRIRHILMVNIEFTTKKF